MTSVGTDRNVAFIYSAAVWAAFSRSLLLKHFLFNITSIIGTLVASLITEHLSGSDHLNSFSAVFQIHSNHSIFYFILLKTSTFVSIYITNCRREIAIPPLEHNLVTLFKKISADFEMLWIFNLSNKTSPSVLIFYWCSIKIKFTPQGEISRGGHENNKKKGQWW